MPRSSRAGWVATFCVVGPLVLSSLAFCQSPDVRVAPRPIDPRSVGVGRLMPDLALKPLVGEQTRLSDAKGAKATVVAITNTSCPLSKRYAPTLAALEKDFAARGVRFVFVNPTASDTREQIDEQLQAHGFQGVYVHDTAGTVVAALGASTTTEVLLLDAARTLVYRGAIDDQYGFGYALDAPRQRFLVDALEAVLAGGLPVVAATDAPGCALDAATAKLAPAASTVTYHNRISRIVARHCVECHRDGGVGPFALTTYEEVSAHAVMLKQVVERGIMPPWFAAPPAPGEPNPWANDCSLAADDRSDLLAWLASDRSVGNAADAPLPRVFASEWQLGTPDLIVSLPNPVDVKATGKMPYVNVTSPTGLTEDRWIQAIEVLPSAREVVHHALVFAEVPGRTRREGGVEGGFFGIYVPGNGLLSYPEGLAKHLPAGSSLRFQMHYTPTGTATKDQTRVGLKFAKSPPKHEVRVAGIADPLLSIPPGAVNHIETAVVTLPFDAHLLAFMPHMHLRGKAFRYELATIDGEQRTLLDVPRYDFNWQLFYRFAEPLTATKGSRLIATGWFDNSDANPANPDPTQTVRWGMQTEEEMMLGYVEYYTDAPAGSESDDGMFRTGGQLKPAVIFGLIDRDRDGGINLEELGRLAHFVPQLKESPILVKQIFLLGDANADGQLSLEEWNNTAARWANKGKK